MNRLNRPRVAWMRAVGRRTEASRYPRVICDEESREVHGLIIIIKGFKCQHTCADPPRERDASMCTASVIRS